MDVFVNSFASRTFLSVLERIHSQFSWRTVQWPDNSNKRTNHKVKLIKYFLFLYLYVARCTSSRNVCTTSATLNFLFDDTNWQFGNANIDLCYQIFVTHYCLYLCYLLKYQEKLNQIKLYLYWLVSRVISAFQMSSLLTRSAIIKYHFYHKINLVSCAPYISKVI